jgi:hypothetical protein
MLLTLLWKWLRGLSRPDRETSASPMLGEADLNVINRSSDTNKSGAVIFEGDAPSSPAGTAG